MANMSYCRFENTSSDLVDCEDHIGETEDMSTYEIEGMISLVETCRRIANLYDEDDIKEWEEELKNRKMEEAN